MASFALFNFEFEPIQNKLRQAELKGMESVLMSASELDALLIFPFSQS